MPKKKASYQRLKEVALGRAMYNLNCVVQVLVLRIHLIGVDQNWMSTIYVLLNRLF